MLGAGAVGTLIIGGAAGYNLTKKEAA